MTSGSTNVMSLHKGKAKFLQFSTPAEGDLDATVDWDDAEVNVDLGLARDPCPDLFAYAHTCEILARAQSKTARPEKLTAPGVAAGPYVLVIFHTRHSSKGPLPVRYEIGLTR